MRGRREGVVLVRSCGVCKRYILTRLILVDSPVSNGTALKSLNPSRTNRYAIIIDALIFHIPSRLKKNRVRYENRPQDT